MMTKIPMKKKEPFILYNGYFIMDITFDIQREHNSSNRYQFLYRDLN